VILNRPFRSVGELGYVYRDMPFKTLDFFSPASADAALLDLFSVRDEPSVMVGLINPSNAPIYVLKALLAGSAKQEALATNTITSAESNTWAAKAARYYTSNVSPYAYNPLTNRSDLATKMMNPTTGLTSALTATSADRTNKAYLEASLRALSSTSNTRTWNLMIDVIAQSGRMAPTAKTVDHFIVEGERRYWLHIALDRYTGKIIAKQLEPVYE
jgi:hypothetical protein